MSSQKTKWCFREVEDSTALSLSKELGLSLLTCRLLVQRGLKTPESAQKFLNPSLLDLPNPFLFADMEKAVDRICEAVFQDETICVYGDYDVDGTTGASLMTQFFKEIGAPVFFYIPHRVHDGYGLTTNVIKILEEEKAKIIITCDCGSTNHKEVDAIQATGVDVIITDHHQVQAPYPSSYAFINHQRTDCTYPEKTLSGVGVAFNLMMAVRARLREKDFFKNKIQPDLRDYLDLVALGTVADMVPLYGGNRILVVNGLKTLNSPKRVGMQVLIEKAGLQKKKITTHSIGFGLGPRINAGGRLDTARVIVELFTTESRERAEELAEDLEIKNKERREIQQRIFLEAVQFVEKSLRVLPSQPEALGTSVDPEAPLSFPPSAEGTSWNLESVATFITGLVTPHAIVVGSSKWHPGVIGIVASKLVEKYYRPTVVIAFEDGVGKGSCRSIHGFDITGALRESSKFLIQCGGHAMAAGLSLQEEQMMNFSKRFEEAVQGKTTPDDFIPTLTLDMETELKNISKEFLYELKFLEPFGTANPEPVLSSRNLKVSSSRIVGEKHLKLYVKDGKDVKEAIAFNKAEAIKELSGSLDLAYVPELNEWQGKTSVQLRVKDLKTNPS